MGFGNQSNMPYGNGKHVDTGKPLSTTKSGSDKWFGDGKRVDPSTPQIDPKTGNR